VLGADVTACLRRVSAVRVLQMKSPAIAVVCDPWWRSETRMSQYSIISCSFHLPVCEGGWA
jgi:hypothetical protein